ncbi:MAG: DUF6290 family protein [Methanomassiliicoccaceae archaeon]|nr:DUF6290 family protein [Methanomassiliicoccaceae archaeon]
MDNERPRRKRSLIAIEDEYCITMAGKALEEWEKDGKKVYTHEEVGKELGFLRDEATE